MQAQSLTLIFNTQLMLTIFIPKLNFRNNPWDKIKGYTYCDDAKTFSLDRTGWQNLSICQDFTKHWSIDGIHKVCMQHTRLFYGRIKFLLIIYCTYYNIHDTISNTVCVLFLFVYIYIIIGFRKSEVENPQACIYIFFYGESAFRDI